MQIPLLALIVSALSAIVLPKSPYVAKAHLSVAANQNQTPSPASGRGVSITGPTAVAESQSWDGSTPGATACEEIEDDESVLPR
jgi:hypothetical protein